MDGLKYLFKSVMMLLDYDFTIYGFTFSFFDIFVVSIILGIVGKIIYSLFDLK